MNVYIRELSRALTKKGMLVDVFTRCTDPDQPRIVEFDEGARVIRLKAGDLSPADKLAVLNYLPEFVCNLRHFTEEHDLTYQFLHSHYWLSSWAGEILNSRWNVPHVAMFHTLGALKNEARPAERESWLRIEVEGRVMNSADAVVAATEHECRHMLQLYPVSPERVRIIPCGVNLAQFRPISRQTARAVLGLPEGPILLFVGRMEPLKGADLLLRAVGGLPEGRRPRVLVVGGDPQGNGEEARLRAIARDLSIEQSVHFVGAIRHDLLPLYYNSADACVVPSYYESFGLAALEALACGVPVVAARVGGLTSFLSDGLNALLFNEHRPETLRSTIQRLMGEPALHATLAQNARQSISHLAWDAVADKVIALYRELCKQHAPRQVCTCRV
ncbi:MAG: glycosyltransferase [Bacteroidetes bacterium]|nr:glycosyltransferase [Bacteroidota bacterium]MCL5026656.1 glycosyltransferase [Chloroflexota bacterium]